MVVAVAALEARREPDRVLWPWSSNHRMQIRYDCLCSLERLDLPRSKLGVLALLVVTTALLASGCGLLSSLTAPSPLWRKLLPAWSPYLVIQSDDGALAGYRDALTRLTSRGALAGARLGLSADGRSAPTVNLVASFGLDIVGIVDNADLFAPDVEGTFDRYRAAYPQVKTFQIGNEITTLPSMPMTIDQYIDVFVRVYAHVVSLYPDVTLVSQATFGAGKGGSEDLAAEATAFSARGVSGARIVLGINVYTETALAAYALVMPTIPRSYRIWVTETGETDPASEVSYVTTTYPQLQDVLRADRIYWYALWAGQSGGDSDYSLIKNATSPPIAPGPLFQLLTEP